ncbi:MAG: hypothetical protein ACM3RP_03270 [Chitinophagales bacterium]
MPEYETQLSRNPEVLDERKEEARAGYGKVHGLREEDSLHRVGVEEGTVLPSLMGWGGSLDPNDTSRVRYLEEVAAELGTPVDGPGREPRSKSHRPR